MNKERKMYASTHTHSKDLFDSQNNPEELCAKFAEYGAAGFVVTQHGVLSVIEPIETYFSSNTVDWDKCHLILIAMDDIGYHVLGKAVTDANDTTGMSVMSEAVLEKYFAPGSEGHGHVIATSACIQGVLSMVLRANDVVSRQSEKKRQHMEKYGTIPTDSHYLQVKQAREELDREIAENKKEKADAKKLSETKFSVREKALKKLKSSGADTRQAEEELNADKKKAFEAAERYKKLVEEGKRLTKKRSAVNGEYEILKERVERWISDEEDIRKLTKNLLSDDDLVKNTVEEARKFDRIFGHGNFYIEVQNHGIDTEEVVYPKLVSVARTLNIPLVASNDIHLVTNSEEELLRRRILRSLRFGNDMEKEHVGDDQLYVKTDEELSNALLKILPGDAVLEAMGNIKGLFDRCNVEYTHENHYPMFPINDGRSADDVLEQEARAGIAWRFPKGFPDERYEKRLAYELNIIKTMGYSHYHLVVKDYLEYGRELGAVPKDRIDEAPFDIDELRAWKKKNGWDVGFSIGPGRGSAVGSLVCYLIGITALDPIKYNLLFERFLNPERVSMPDIDSDLSNTVRQKVIEYVQYKYGADSVCGIMTTNAQAPKGTIRIAAKYYGYETRNDGAVFLSLADTLAKSVPNEPYITFDKELDNGNTLYETLKRDNADNPDAIEILRWAKIIEGCFTSYGAHAAGIVISDGNPIKNYIPLRWNQKLSEWTTQMDMVSVEENGFLKMDFLGLKTLDIITDCIKAIKKDFGISLDPLSIPLDDSAVFEEILCKGRTNSVFQFESAGMKNMLRRFHPTSFEDLIILVAMFRPGPLQYLDGVIEVKHGKPAEYITKELVPLLQNTYGAIVFQEQVMQIFQELAGYTLGGADQVRRAMSKKKLKVLEAERPVFIYGSEERNIKGCVANGITAENANQLFDQMTDFAKYAFNRSHAAVYALLGYYTAWLKLYYPAEFLMSAMNWAEQDDIPGLMQEAKKLGVNVKAPDVNKSDSGFIVSNGEILFGLGSVKAVGSSADDIISERKKGGQFHSYTEFFARVPAKKNAVENLIRAGAFDAFCENRLAMEVAIPDIQKLVKKIREKEELVDAIDAYMPLIGHFATDEELIEDQVQKGKKAVLKKVGTEASLVKKKNTAVAALREARCSLNDFHINTEIPEDHDERMNREHTYLGMYVTEHPLDMYPDPEDIGITPISDLTEETECIFGMIRGLTIKRRKSDGKPMAFFTLEDKTGEIDVCVFTRQYEAFGKNLSDGDVLAFTGNVQTEERNDETVMKFFANGIRKIRKAAKAYYLPVSSFYAFLANEGTDFKKRYMEAGGHPLLIFDESTGSIRKMSYCVSDEALRYNGVSEYVV